MEISKRAKILTAGTITGVFIVMLILWLRLHQSKTIYLLAGVLAAGILSITAWLLILHNSFNWRKLSLSSQTPNGTDLRLEYSFLRKVAGLPAKFRYEDLQRATDDFSAMIGRGASASVFKGILEDGTQVAVKRIELGAEQADTEFRSEVSAIASVQHVNLVRILGYCLVSTGPRFLVYDFIPNGSLDKWIFPRAEASPSLPWRLRYKVAIDVAKALAYLHQDCRSRVLHLDIKPENILLDEAFRAVVSDFGLSKLMGRDQSRVVTTIRGTRGYLAPEWFLENGVSEKSDIYSYGMVLMEMVGGRRNVMVVGDERRWSYFPKMVAEKVREGKVMEVMDERVKKGGGVEEREVMVMACVALWCAQEEAKLRPSMARVVDMLEGRLVVEMPPETEMIMLDLLAVDGAGYRCDQKKPDDVGSTVTCSFSLSFLSGR
ncbi:Non-specific serine/threonine protein kinase protein [Dioscorea alata]|uniref:Non-specific serine/threonine protein kinase protein n=1 Tax=Dioscorea alata TaxID=55571 RepID=A0ACB7WFS3_DIOAL|nr:Non-specific serine/threonine protein kinase protein [Dioscorea alata]